MDKHEAKGAIKDAVGKVKDGFGGLTGKPTTQVDGKIDQASGKLEGKFGGQIDDLKEQGADLADAGSRLAGQAADQVRDAARATRAQASEYAHSAADAGAQASRTIGETAKRQPILSVVAIGAAGYLIGFLVHSPHSPFAPARSTRR
ncbi:CsbD family protein [Lichenicoccus roseus]|uniref:CsbD family protein n=1 Tax=Lichenicoccus roseus TaxID=2683649 RepID=A0A5R9J1Y2_9PROT|nr:hypothetical protein [Lichenicoccus roseus]TLU71645.1 hypothetical protein FE263_14305 [Lichenicoccus roseus]